MVKQPEKSKPPRVALTGGIGSGKTAALGYFAALGAAALDSDRLVHRFLDRGNVRRQVSAALEIPLIPAGEEGRRRLADWVFRDRAKLAKLQDIMFPLVKSEVWNWLQGPEVSAAPMAVVELPMLFEAGMEPMFDYVVLVTAPAEIRRRRAGVGGVADDFERRAAHQMPEADKRKRCHASIENTGSLKELQEYVSGIFAALTGEPGRGGAGASSGGGPDGSGSRRSRES